MHDRGEGGVAQGGQLRRMQSQRWVRMSQGLRLFIVGITIQKFALLKTTIRLSLTKNK